MVYHGGIEKDKEGVDGWIVRMNKMGYKAYENLLTNLEKKQINDYFKAFLFNMDTGQINDGWLYQIRNSFTGKFLLPNSSFEKDFKAIQNIKAFILDDLNNWGMGKKSMLGDAKPKKVDDTFSDFIDDFIKDVNFPKESQNVEGAKMKLIAQLFNTISNKQQIEFFQK